MANTQKYLDLTGLSYYNDIMTSLLSDMRTEYKGMIWTGTTAEYEAAVAAGQIAEGIFVNLTDADEDNDIGSIAKTDIQSLFS